MEGVPKLEVKLELLDNLKGGSRVGRCLPALLAEVLQAHGAEREETE